MLVILTILDRWRDEEDTAVPDLSIATDVTQIPQPLGMSNAGVLLVLLVKKSTS